MSDLAAFLSSQLLRQLQDNCPGEMRDNLEECQTGMTLLRTVLEDEDDSVRNSMLGLKYFMPLK